MDKTDSLAERLERVDHGVLCSCDTMRTNPHAPSCRLFKVTAEVRAFLAERVTWQKIDDAISGTNKREASAVLALLRREVGG